MAKPEINLKSELTTIKSWVSDSGFLGNILDLHVRSFVKFPNANLHKQFSAYCDGNYYRANNFKTIDYLLGVVYLYGRCRAIEDLDLDNTFNSQNIENTKKEIQNDNTDLFKTKLSLGDTVYFYKLPIIDKLYEGTIVELSLENLTVRDNDGKLFQIEWEEVYKAVV